MNHSMPPQISMTDKIKDRSNAAKINPIVPLVGRDDTMNNCAQMLDTFGALLSSSEAVSTSSMACVHLFTGVISAALMIEVEGDSPNEQ